MTKILRSAALLALLASLTMVPSAAALTALDSDYGTPQEGASARSLAMGQVGVSLFHGSSSAVQNPALLGSFQGKALLDLQIGIRESNENRYVPLFDTFDNFVTETAYALNRDSYASGHGGVVWHLPGERQGALTVGIFERYDADFDYEEEIRKSTTDEPRDELEQLNQVTVDGRLRSWSIAYGREVLPSVHVGLAAHRYFGDIERSRAEVPVDGDPTRTRLERELSGWGFGVGAHVRGFERLDVGVSVESSVTLSGTHTLGQSTGGDFEPLAGAPAPGDYELEYPKSVALGLSYHPRNDLRTVFSVEARRRFWEDLDDEFADAQAELDGSEGGADLGLRNTWDFRTGVEHIFYNGMPARFGFRFVENYSDRDSERVVFSLGTGYVFDGMMIDLTGVYTRQTSRQEFLFDEGASGIPNPSLTPKVEDSVIQFVLGISREF